MIPQGFIDYHTMRNTRIRSFIQRLRRFCTVDDLHELRVEIKRLRAFYYLIDWIDRGFCARKHLVSVERLFKATGPLRDLHVQMAASRKWAVESNGNLSEYYNSLAIREKRRRPFCATALRKFDQRSLSKGLLSVRKALGKYVEFEVVYRAEQRLSVMLRDLLISAKNSVYSEKALHDIRIETKESRYVLEVLTQCRFSSAQDTELNKGLLECHRALGRWHDCIVQSDNVRKYMADKPDDFYFDRPSYARFMEHLSEQRDLHLDHFRQNWGSYQEQFLSVSKKVDAL